MISGMLLALVAGLAVGTPAAPVAPAALVVATAKGDVRIAVRPDAESGPLVAASALVPALGGLSSVVGAWVQVEISGVPFRLLLGAPYYTVGGVLKPLVGAAVVKRDSLFLPLQFVTQLLPAELKDRFRYYPSSGRLEELLPRRPAAFLVADEAKPRGAAAERALPVAGLAKGHVVTIDPGHGGVDPGNPGMFFPRGLTESDVTLQVGLLVRKELLRRGVGVIMTRTTDTLIDLHERAGYCTERCGLFVSLHVNSLPRRSGFTKVSGFETYFLAEAKTEDAARVARMENEAIRFEEPKGEQPGGLDFILKDLQTNEYLRESARLAELMQSHVAEAHTGTNKGVKQAGLAVLTTARRPAVLFEMGFSTNPEDARLMTETRSQRNLAAAVADAIVNYLLEYQQRVGTTRTASQSGAERE